MGVKKVVYENAYVDKRREEIVAGMTAKQIWEAILMKGLESDVNLKKMLLAYEESFPKMLRVNRRLLLGIDEDDE